MERELLHQIWPIFSAEAREHLQGISSGLLELEKDPGRPGLLDGIRRTAHSLKGSSASLGLVDVETLSHAIEGSLAGFDASVGLSAETVQAALDAVEAIEEALASADAGGEPRIRALQALLAALGPGGAPPAVFRPPDPSPAAPAPDAAGLTSLDALEADLRRLCAPVKASDRRKLAEQAVAAARALAAAIPAAAPLAIRIAESFEGLAAGGEGGARAAAAAAGGLVELRRALERRGGGPPAAPARAAPGGGDKSIRVLASTLESLARQLELLALAESRHQRRARELATAEAAAREAIRGLEQASHAMRVASAAAGRPELEGAVQRLRGVIGDLRRLSRDGQRDAEQQRLAGAVLREDLRALRMVPAALVLEPLRRAVRDVAGRLGKKVELELSGADVRLDRRIVDELRDPLLHLVRNAVDHGIEDPEARRLAGKPAAGRVRVRVEPRGSRVGVVVEDDGAGLDVAAVREAAIRNGVIAAEAAARLSDADAVRLVFHPGLTTARQVTEISGRGVGLDVVQATAQRLQGSVDIRHEPGRGTRFDLELPLTLAATSALLFRIGREVAALPADGVERVLLLSPVDVGTVAGRPTVKVGDQQLPFAPLAQVLGLPPGEGRPHRFQPALVVALGAQRAVVAVDELLGQQDVVVSSLGSRAAKVAHLAGASVLDDGRVVAVLAAAEIFRRVQPAAARAAGPARPRILVADDSLTTRAAMKAVLEIAGFAVVPAADGEEALALIRDQGCQVVVSDVQMPRLDGLELTRRLKADPQLRSIPVILITSLDAPEDRSAGLEAGADGYLVKREVERGKLLELVRQLLPGRA
jgi:two-component system, chemotaxis family, sensor kinase CheA